MKTRHALLSTLLAALLPIGLASAGTYDPGRIDLELAPGDEATVSYSYSDPSAFFVQPYVSMSGDAELEGWISDISAGLGFGSGQATVTLNVPEDAASGHYEVVLFGRAWSGPHAQVEDGMTLAVTVGGTCADLAEFVPGSENEIMLWAPNHAMHSVELLGEIDVPDGCSIVSASYSIEDEYGVHTGSGELEITGDAEGYRATPLIEASRRGNDKDGRTYTVTVSIVTEAGEATQTRTVVVKHDRRDKSDDKPGKKQ